MPHFKIKKFLSVNRVFPIMIKRLNSFPHSNTFISDQIDITKKRVKVNQGLSSTHSMGLRDGVPSAACQVSRSKDFGFWRKFSKVFTIYGRGGQFRAGTIRLSSDTIRIAIHAMRYDTYHDISTF